MGAIYRREMGAFFTSGVAYVFLTVFTLLSGIFFFFGVIGSGTTETSPMFSSMFIVVLFLIPILTMKLLSEEKKNRTDQGLLTAPIGLWSIVLGKYLAALTLFIIAESVVFIYSIILAYLGDVDEVVRKAMLSVSFYSRYLEFTQGIFNITSIVFFVSVAFIFNFLTVRVLDKRRWG